MISEVTKEILESAYSDSFYFEKSKDVHIQNSDKVITGFFIEPVEMENE
jgi:hypothetical protein